MINWGDSMNEGKELNLNRISNIIVFFSITFIITVFLNIFEIVNVINVQNDNISLIKRNTGIYFIFEGRFKNSEYPAVKIENDLASEEILDSFKNGFDRIPKSYFKNKYIKIQILNLVLHVKLTFITFILADIVISYLKHLNPFTNEILNKLKILQYYFLFMTVLGYFFKIVEIFHKNINLSILFGSPYFNLILFSCVYVIKSIIEHEKNNTKI